MPVRIATFNVENLMARFDFSGWRDDHRRDRALSMVEIDTKARFRELERARVVAHADDTRQLTALALADTDADIVCVQEVENLETLAAFERNYLGRMFGLDYPQRVLMEGNDTRGIDVGLMARERARDGTPIEIVRSRSHKGLTYRNLDLGPERMKALAAIGIEPQETVFRRDCLEVDLRIGGRMASVFVVHFKSMGPWRDGVPGRTHTHPVRRAEAAGVAHVIDAKFKGRAADMRWLVAGDMNDYRERLAVSGSRLSKRGFAHRDAPDCALEPLFAIGEDLVSRRPAEDRWTLYHAGGPQAEGGAPQERATQHLVQLDYLIASPRLAKRNAEAVPDILRRGQPARVPFPPGQEVDLYPRTGWDRPKGSDHCPVAVTLDW